MTNSLNVNYYSVWGRAGMGVCIQRRSLHVFYKSLLYSLKVTQKLLFLLCYLASEHQDPLVYNTPMPGLREKNWSQLTNLTVLKQSVKDTFLHPNFGCIQIYKQAREEVRGEYITQLFSLNYQSFLPMLNSKRKAWESMGPLCDLTKF